MEVCGKDIDYALHKYGIRRDIDVCQLYLAKKGLTNIPDLSRFSMLRYLWLNNNKIKEISCHTLNCCLTELYLQNNEITSISGVLSHLTCLRVLLLHNNQMKRLEDPVAELRNMQHLHTVSFFLNPFSQDPEYRQYVVHHLPSVQLLDRREVKQEERRSSFQLFSTERHRVLQSLAFGRRAETSDMTMRDTNDDGHLLKGSCGARRRFNRHRNPFAEIADPRMRKAMQRSIMQFSSVDWSAIPMDQQRRQGELDGQPGPNILTVKFR